MEARTGWWSDGWSDVALHSLLPFLLLSVFELGHEKGAANRSIHDTTNRERRTMHTRDWDRVGHHSFFSTSVATAEKGGRAADHDQDHSDASAKLLSS